MPKTEARPIYLRERDRLAREHAGMIPEGSDNGYPTTRFDPLRSRWYHLDSTGDRIYHGKPEGLEYDDTGQIIRPAPVLAEGDEE